MDVRCPPGLRTRLQQGCCPECQCRLSQPVGGAQPPARLASHPRQLSSTSISSPPAQGAAPPCRAGSAGHPCGRWGGAVAGGAPKSPIAPQQAGGRPHSSPTPAPKLAPLPGQPIRQISPCQVSAPFPATCRCRNSVRSSTSPRKRECPAQWPLTGFGEGSLAVCNGRAGRKEGQSAAFVAQKQRSAAGVGSCQAGCNASAQCHHQQGHRPSTCSATSAMMPLQQAGRAQQQMRGGGACAPQHRLPGRIACCAPTRTSAPPIA